MDAEPLWSSNDGWRTLHLIAEDLLSIPDISLQADYAEKELSKLTSYPARIFLSEIYKPLPQETKESQNSTNPGVRFVNISDCVGEFYSVEQDDRLLVKIPIKNNADRVGYLQIEYPGKTKASEIPMDFLLSIGAYLAKVFELSRLQKLKDWRLEQISLVRQVNRELVKLRDPARLFESVVDLIQSTFEFYFVAIYTLEEKTGKIIYRASSGKELSEKQMMELAGSDGIPSGEGFIGRCGEERAEVYCADVHQDDHYREVDGLKEAKSELCLPLCIGEKSLGVLDIILMEPFLPVA